MRALLVVALVASTAAADPLPAGALGLTFGGMSGTGADAKRIGYGYTFGFQAAWQPMTTEQRIPESLSRRMTRSRSSGGGTSSRTKGRQKCTA